MQVQTGSIPFGLKTGSPDEKTDVKQFANPVTQVSAILRGFRVGYKSGEDHHFGLMVVDLSASIEPDQRTVTVRATCGLRDKSSDWDDSYSGEVHYTLIGDP